MKGGIRRSLKLRGVKPPAVRGMIDIGGKKAVKRRAVAEGSIRLGKESIRRIKEGKVEKGDVLSVAEVAGMQAVKKTSELIPHCHPIGIEGVKFAFEIKNGIRVRCDVKSTGKTGVEMEALVGVSVALLTVWDMVKRYEKDSKGQYPETVIEGIRVIEKVKG